MSKLTEGLEIIYNMELNDYLMLKAIGELDKEIKRLNYTQKPAPPPTINEPFLNPVYAIPCIVIGAVIGFIVGIILAVTAGNGFFYTLLDVIVSPIVGAVIGGLCGGVVGLIVMIICKKQDKKSAIKAHKKEVSAYSLKMIAYEDIKSENKAKQNILISQRSSLVKRQKESLNKLIGFYDTMGIDETYRNIIPIGYMLELSKLGVSNKLEGVDGLYYLVRKELRNDKLQYSLNEISNKLDSIISNQHNMYHQITNVEKKCNKLINSAVASAELAVKNNQLLNEAVKNTSITAYNSERVKQEIQFQNFMKYY